LRVSVLNIAQARAQYRIQRAALFPLISVDVSASHTRTPASLSQSGKASVAEEYFVGLSASWEIDFFGRLQSLKDAALEQYLATGPLVRPPRSCWCPRSPIST